MDTDDRFFIWINRDDAEFQGAGAFKPLLERLERSFLPRPTVLGADGKAGRAVKGYLDPAVLKALDRKKNARAANPDAQLDVVVWQLPNRTAISIFVPLAVAAADELRDLLRDAIQIVSPTYATVRLERAGSALNDEVYQMRRRTFYANGLYWLNFFGPPEEALQGGPALAKNPAARATRLPQGLLLEVGDGPLDILTTEGRRRLIDATAAMPPVAAQTPVATNASEG
jgi:hypothetical protein